ncbi:hypothetical protein MRB53_009509 [Persea americana]|uniref:Uncharacterized protein n=1 Tax=Persea americana TaxID=3435 RepID=A0ACC2LPC8_PERAE|nr:hypothetical protein MRB53_009509 [Persea americana]
MHGGEIILSSEAKKNVAHDGFWDSSKAVPFVLSCSSYCREEEAPSSTKKAHAVEDLVAAIELESRKTSKSSAKGQ